MKRNYLFKNTGCIASVIALLAVTLLSSCLKDTSPGTINFADSPPIVSFQYYGFAATPILLKIHGTATDTTSVEVALSVASLTLKTPVTVQVSLDNGAALLQQSADLAAGDTDRILPTNLYTLVNNGLVTISPGQHIVHVKLNFVGNKVDFSNPDITNIFALHIATVSPSSVVIATNLNTAVCELTLQSIFEGTYSVKGYVLRLVNGAQDPTLGGYFHGDSEFLGTINSTTVGFAPLWRNDTDAGGVGATQFAVGSGNAVTVSSADNATLMNEPGYNNRYDPSTKTFYVSYSWSGGNRMETDTVTYTGP